MGSGESCAWLEKSYLLLNRQSSQQCWRKKLPVLRGNAQQGGYVLHLVLWSDSRKKTTFGYIRALCCCLLVSLGQGGESSRACWVAAVMCNLLSVSSWWPLGMEEKRTDSTRRDLQC